MDVVARLKWGFGNWNIPLTFLGGEVSIIIVFIARRECGLCFHERVYFISLITSLYKDFGQFS
jgi:hypothetical protein